MQYQNSILARENDVYSETQLNYRTNYAKFITVDLEFLSDFSNKNIPFRATINGPINMYSFEDVSYFV